MHIHILGHYTCNHLHKHSFLLYIDLYKHGTLFVNQWLNAKTLVLLDKSEKLHVMDVRSEEVLEVIDVSGTQLVYGTSYFKSLATGGNVSQALVSRLINLLTLSERVTINFYLQLICKYQYQIFLFLSGL